MPKTLNKNNETNIPIDIYTFHSNDDIGKKLKPYTHLIRKGICCSTESIGHETPENKSPAELVVDSSQGFVPLWEYNTTLRWRFNEASMAAFINPEVAKNSIRRLLGDAILLWGNAVPVRFSEQRSSCDFEIEVIRYDDCNSNGCVLASAFFPNGGQNKLYIYPQMFSQTMSEQVETMAHEIGHIFGLRHWFAKISESNYPSEYFGNPSTDRFSIMNYGAGSVMTKRDQDDLRALYKSVWSGALREINGTPIQLVRSYSGMYNSNPAFAFRPEKYN
jgi:hypothetical protein